MYPNDMDNAAKLKLVPVERPTEDPPEAETRLVPLSEIQVVLSDNVRTEYDDDYVEKIGCSIANKGQLQSILIRPLAEPGPDGEKYRLVAGFCRVLGAKKAGVTSLFAIIREYASEGKASAANTAENIERLELSLYDLVMRFQKFASLGWTPIQISMETGVELQYTRTVYELATEVAPALLRQLRNDETHDMIVRLQYCANKIKGYDKEQKFAEQVKWWKAEGWREWEKKRVSSVNKPRPASSADIEELADRIRAARGVKAEDDHWVSLSGEQAEAVAGALMWCAFPKSRKSPL